VELVALQVVLAVQDHRGLRDLRVLVALQALVALQDPLALVAHQALQVLLEEVDFYLKVHSLSQQ